MRRVNILEYESDWLQYEIHWLLALLDRDERYAHNDCFVAKVAPSSFGNKQAKPNLDFEIQSDKLQIALMSSTKHELELAILAIGVLCHAEVSCNRDNEILHVADAPYVNVCTPYNLSNYQDHVFN